jgi:hypothetical protein
LRGGSWADRQDAELATTRRFWLDPTQRLPFTGFRCVKEFSREQDAQPQPDRPDGQTGGRP